jgi:hypothetical protein
LLPQNVNPGLFSLLNPGFKLAGEPKLFLVPNDSSSRTALHASQYYSAFKAGNILRQLIACINNLLITNPDYSFLRV